MTARATREELALEHQCPRPRCGALPGTPCRARVPQYTPLGFYHSRYGTVMVHPHPERLALVPEEQS
jgi:hypothetical protein